VQSPDGRWVLDHPAFKDKDKGQINDVAGTALGLLPLLGAGKTHKPAPDNPFDRSVERGLAFLLRKQNRDARSQHYGDFGGGAYGHGLATIAVCEAYSLTQDPVLRRPAQLAVNYIVRAQHDAGGWRYAPGQPGDLSVSGWQIMALKSAQLAGLDVPAVTLRKAGRFLDARQAPDEGYGYLDARPTPTMSAVGLLCRQYLDGWGPRSPRLLRGIDAHLRPHPPGARQDAYYCYYATQVMFHFGGQGWKEWNAQMRETLVKTQEKNGSWPAAGDAWGRQGGGRLMVTAMNLLTLEVYYRYLPLYARSRAARQDGGAGP
jgi:hypothetical protein